MTNLFVSQEKKRENKSKLTIQVKNYLETREEFLGSEVLNVEEILESNAPSLLGCLILKFLWVLRVSA